MLALDDDIADLVRGRGVHLGQLTQVTARRHPDRVAVDDPSPSPGLAHGRARDHADAEEAVARFAAALRGLGVEEGHRVLVAIDNRVDVLWLVLALARLGAVPVPVNDRLTPHEVDGILTATGATYVVADAEPHRRLTTGTTTVADGPRWILTDDGTAADHGDDGTGATIAGWLRAHPSARVQATPRPPDATVVLLTTSGTTGVPKAAALTSHGLLAIMGRLAALPLAAGPRAERDRVFAALPLPHVMGLAVALGCLVAGVPLLRLPRFDAPAALDVIERERPNVVVGVPTMYADLEAAGIDERDVSSVQLWGSAADAMPAERARRYQRRGALVRAFGRAVGQAAFLDVYGMVELSGAAAVRLYPPSPVSVARLPAMSVVLPGVEARVVDDEGARLGWGSVGRLQFRGGGVLEEYEGRPDAGPDDDGWFDTGDLARLWPGGLFQLAGRTRDRLKVGGFSVFPAEVEETLVRHDGVAEVALVGLEHERLGEEPVALVVPRDAATFDLDAWLAWARENVAGYRRPRRAWVVDELPRGNNAKLARAEATALARDLAAADAGAAA